MQTPPAVSLACRDGGAWRAATALLHALAAASLVAWPGGPWFALAAVPAGALIGAWAWRRSPPSHPVLSWDGHGWTLDGRSGRAGVALDLGAWMLVRFDADAGAGPGPRRAWLPLSPVAGPWAALRTALYAGDARAPAGPAGRLAG